MLFRLFLILVVFFINKHGLAQVVDENNFIRFTTSNGLSDNYVTGITQDRTGYMWIATNRGINRFDGSTFKTFLKNSRSNSIPDNTIYSMRLFGDELAIATNDGAQMLSTKTLQQINLNIPTSPELHYWSNACLYARPDELGNYAVSTKTGFYIFSRNGKIKSRYDHYTEKDIGSTWMLFGNHLFALPDGKILQKNSAGILLYDGFTNRIINDTQAFSPGVKQLLKIWKEQKTLFFAVSRTNFLLLNRKNNSFDLVDLNSGYSKSFKACFNLLEEIGWQTKLSHLYDDLWAINSKNKGFFILQIDTIGGTISCQPLKYFNSQFCNSVFVDKQKKMWVGTDKGVYMEKLHPEIIKAFPVKIPVQKNFSIKSLLVTHDKIFAGTNNREIIVLNKQTRKVINLVTLPNPQFEKNIINQIVSIDQDTAWLTVSNEIWWLNTQNLHFGKLKFSEIDDSTNYIGFLYKDINGNIWIHSNKINTVFYYNRTTGYFKTINQKEHQLLKVNLLNAVAEDKNGNLWMSGDAIVRWNHKEQRIDSLIEFLPTQSSRKKGFIVMADSLNDIWTLVNDDGFAKLTNNLIHTRPQNLFFNTTRTLLPTMLRNKVFIPTNEGVGYFDISNGKGVIFTVRDGLPDEVVSSNRFVTDPSDNSTWFACKNFICNLSASPENNYVRPPVLTISELSVINGSIFNYPDSTVRLRYNQNDIRILFGAINFTDPENMRFAYRFKNNKDSSWIDAGNQPHILLTNIGHGMYNLQVKVYAYDNKWPEQIKEITIHIKPPFWKTGGFIFSFILLVMVSAFYLYQTRIKRIQQKANLDKLLAQTEMKALHSQMNPHFIFNCLNSIREMILSEENRQASHYLSKFAQLIRITLDNSTKQFISLQNTIDYLHRYLEMEKIRTDHFTYSFEIDNELEPENVFLSPMLIQPFIENSIWHGQKPRRPMHLSIRFNKDNEELICIVEDDGIGIETSLRSKTKSNHHPVGIANIRQRIRLLNEKYNLKSTVLIEDKSFSLSEKKTGTKVTLNLPVKNVEL